MGIISIITPKKTAAIVDGSGFATLRTFTFFDQITRYINGFSNQFIHLSLGTTQDIGGANGTAHYIDWDTEDTKDTGFTHSTTTNPSRIQVDATARYSIRFAVSGTQGGGARTTLMSSLRVDGTTAVLRGRQRNYSRGSAYGDISLLHYTELDLTSGQYIEAVVTVDDTDGAYTINTINAECEMIVRRIG